MDNYPPGTWAGDPRAPWNEPDHAEVRDHALRQVMGEDANLTSETLAEFVGDVDTKRQPMLTKTPELTGPISTAELLALMLDRRQSDTAIAAATRELTSRYLEDPYTRTVIEAQMERLQGATA